MQNIIVLAFLLGFTSCTQKKDSIIENQVEMTSGESIKKQQQDLSQKSVQNHQFTVENQFLDYLRFSGSVEVEILKIVDRKFKNTEKIPSQLMILSQLLDSKLNKKRRSRSTAIFYNCNKIEIRNKSDYEVDILRTCERKPQVIASLTKKNVSMYEISFIQSEWQSVIGDSALLNQKNKVCQLIISNRKVHEVSCDNTLITIGTGSQLEEIKLHNFKFDRSALNQIVVTGGRFKDFLERSQIKIVVPEEGKIKFDEQELSFQDDYAEPLKIPQPTMTPEKDFIPPTPIVNELDMNNPNPTGR